MHFFYGLWPIFWHYSVFTLIIAGFVAVAIFATALEVELAQIPLIGVWLSSNIGHIREWAILGAVLTASHVLIYGIGVSNGETRVNSQWDAAEKAAVKQAQDARASAVTSIEHDPDFLRSDPYNRDH